MAGSAPTSRTASAFASSRISARTSTSRALSPRRTSVPVVPVAPVTSSIRRNLLDGLQLAQELGADLTAIHGDGPAGQPEVEIVAHLDRQLAAVERHPDR